MENGRLTGIAEALRTLADAGADRPLESLAPSELVAVNAAAGALRRQVDAVCTQVAAEVARQSRVGLGTDSLARKQGFRTPESMISATTGIPVGEAKRMVQVGEATAPRRSISGEALPEKHPHIAAAVRSGAIGVAAASAIIALIVRVTPRADAVARDRMEAHLVQAAIGLRPDELAKLLVRAEAYLDPDGAERKQAEIFADRALTISEREGVLRVEFQSDVASGAPVKAAIEAIVTAILQNNRDRNDRDRGNPADGDTVGEGGRDDTEADQRSIRQLRADALIELCQHTLGCEQVPTRPTATVVVRMTLDQLHAGVGQATIDGIDHPIAAGQVRRMAADLQIIPMVLGSGSEILDLGRSTRLFTARQKLALAERDGGCVGCGAPPMRCHTHHLNWWSRGGRTDLSNGVLLCSGCHHRLHDDGWDIRIDGPGIDAKVWMIPPPWIDPQRRPRLGGRQRYDLPLAA